MDHRGDRYGRAGRAAAMTDAVAQSRGRAVGRSGGLIGIGVLVSGGGTNLQAILDACARREIPGRVVVVASTTAKAYALVRARQAGGPAVLAAPGSFPHRQTTNA